MKIISSVLLVDDDDTTNFLNQALLQRMAVTETVLVATNGLEAIHLLHTHCAPVATPTCPVLIFLDLKMPLMNGFEFLQAYSQRPPGENPAVIIIMLTTSLHPRDLEQIKNLSVAGFLTKPLTREKISGILQQHFGLPVHRN